MVLPMLIVKRALSLLLILQLTLAAVPPARASAYDGHPKLVVILVIDQFREDYLERYHDQLKARGFKLFLEKGAYFPDCYYNYANTKTAPGHSSIGTGAYTDGHGINSNEWWDLSRNKQRPVTSVEDERYHLLGLINASSTEPGASPRNLRASTVGDELRLATQGRSQVWGISLKDRAAILPAGAAANGAFWIDGATGSFITSTYYMNELPKWATAFNGSERAAEAAQEAGVEKSGEFYEQVGKTPAANTYEIDFAKALITGEQLGKHGTTDMLTLSLSAPDLVGHTYGPDSPQEQQMVLALDSQLDSFFTWLEAHIDGGLNNVWITLSADHGVAPVPGQAATLGMPSATIDMTKFIADLNEAMNAKFSPGEKVVYILPKQGLPYLSLNRPSFEVAGINELEAEQAVQAHVEGVVVLQVLLAAQRADDRGLQQRGCSQQLGPGIGAAGPGQDRHFFGRIQQCSSALERCGRRQHRGCRTADAERNRRRGASLCQYIARDHDDRHTPLGNGGAHGDCEHARHLLRGRDHLAKVRAAAKQLLRPRLLEIVGADLSAWNLCGNGEHGSAATVAVV